MPATTSTPPAPAHWCCVTPNARGKRLVLHHTYHAVLRLWVTYTPTGGNQRSVGFYGLHLPK